MTISVGKYTNSYKANLGEQSTNGYVYRLADGQIDDTCFSTGKTYHSIEEAQTALDDIREFSSVLEKAINEAKAIGKTYRVTCYETVRGNGAVCWSGFNYYDFDDPDKAMRFMDDRSSKTYLYDENNNRTEQYIDTTSMQLEIIENDQKKFDDHKLLSSRDLPF